LGSWAWDWQLEVDAKTLPRLVVEAFRLAERSQTFGTGAEVFGGPASVEVGLLAADTTAPSPDVTIGFDVSERGFEPLRAAKLARPSR
jgi:hypothetical protein